MGLKVLFPPQTPRPHLGGEGAGEGAFEAMAFDHVVSMNHAGSSQRPTMGGRPVNRQDGCESQPERRKFFRVLGRGLVGFLLGTIGGRRSAVDAAGTGDSVLAPSPRRPRPQTLSPALFTGKTARAYRIAREVPELIEQMPCYCGCFKGNGHRNNLDCYVDRHAFG